MSHMHPDQVAAYLDGTLQADEVAQVEAHLAECAECRRETAGVEQILAAHAPRVRTRVVTALTVVAAVVAALLLLPIGSWFPVSDDDPVRTGPAVESEGLARLEPLRPSIDLVDGNVRVTLRWVGGEENLSYRVTLSAGTGRTLWTGETTDTEMLIPPDVTLASGRPFFWYVDVTLANGEAATTGIQSLSIP